MDALRQFLRLSRPVLLIGVAIIYAIGGGIAHYLGAAIRWDAYWLGLLWVLVLQQATLYLVQYFSILDEAVRRGRPLADAEIGPEYLPRRTALTAAYTCLAFLASLSVLLFSRIQPPLEVYVMMGAAFAGAFVYAVPPLRLQYSGYGELLLAVLAGYLVPAFAFLLQEGLLHRLVAMTSFSLVALLLAMMLALQLKAYLEDVRLGRRTLLVRLGWENGMLMHNILILLAFLVLVFSRNLGYPWFATLAGLLAFPVGIFQIWQMQRISGGKKPNWNMLTIGAMSLVGLEAYLLALAFWTH